MVGASSALAWAAQGGAGARWGVGAATTLALTRPPLAPCPIPAPFAEPQACGAKLRRAGDVADGASERPGAVQGALRSAQNLDAFQVLEQEAGKHRRVVDIGGDRRDAGDGIVAQRIAVDVDAGCGRALSVRALLRAHLREAVQAARGEAASGEVVNQEITPRVRRYVDDWVV